MSIRLDLALQKRRTCQFVMHKHTSSSFSKAISINFDCKFYLNVLFSIRNANQWNFLFWNVRVAFKFILEIAIIDFQVTDIDGFAWSDFSLVRFITNNNKKQRQRYF